jgi:protein ImuB
MPRLASLYLPYLPIERIRRARRRKAGSPLARHSRESGNPASSSLRGEERQLDPRFRGDDEKESRYRMNGAFLPPPSLRKALTPEEQAARYADCSCPRGGGWRPGARWAENSKERAQLAALKDRQAREREVEAQIAALPVHQRPQMRELGRRTEAAPVIFKSSPERGGGPSAQQMVEGASSQRVVPRKVGPLRQAFGLPPPRSGEDQPLVTTHRSGQRVVIAAACPRAEALGLSPGLPLTQARALCPGLDVRDADPDGDAAFLARLALFAARRWTPRAAVADERSLVLDLTGVAHLFGGEERLCARILAFCARLGVTARIAVAGSHGAAHALARHDDAPITLCPDGGEAAMLAPLPVAALRLDEAALATAARLGLDRIGDLLAMPRAPLQRRFGAALLMRLDQATGRLSEPFDPILPGAPPSVLLRFQEPIGSAEVIATAMAAALRALVEDLAEKGLAARTLSLACQRVDDQVEQVRVGLARATRDAAHLLRLLTPKIETIDPGFGIERMRLTATRVEPLGPQPIDGALAGDRPAPDLVPLIDRIAGRIGETRIFRMSALESDLPERSLRPLPPLDPVRSWPRWPRPARLLSPPEPVEGVVALLPDQPPRRFTWRGRRYRVARADGPERLYGEWWRRRGEAAAVRDYFQVEDEEGARFWLFRKGDGVDPRTGDLSWWMQGAMG